MHCSAILFGPGVIHTWIRVNLYVCGSVAKYCKVWLIGACTCRMHQQEAVHLVYVLISGILDLDHGKSNN